MKRSEFILRLIEMAPTNEDPDIFIDHQNYMFTIGDIHFDSDTIYIPTKEI